MTQKRPAHSHNAHEDHSRQGYPEQTRAKDKTKIRAALALLRACNAAESRAARSRLRLCRAVSAPPRAGAVAACVLGLKQQQQQQ